MRLTVAPTMQATIAKRMKAKSPEAGMLPNSVGYHDVASSLKRTAMATRMPMMTAVTAGQSDAVMSLDVFSMMAISLVVYYVQGCALTVLNILSST